MGQLEVFGLDDNLIIALIGGTFYTYFAEEIDSTVESLVTYIFSTNFSSKKCKHLKYSSIILGNSDEEQFKIINNLKLAISETRTVEKTLEERIFWQELMTRITDSDKKLSEDVNEKNDTDQ